MRILLAIVALSAIACKHPPDAPAELDELCAYLYSHLDDEESDELSAGLDNLNIWLDVNMDSTLEGYTVNNLDQETVNGLDGTTRDLTGLVGASVGNVTTFGTTKIVDALTMVNPTEIWPDTYTSYDRTYETDPDCFADKTCDMLEVDNVSVANFAMGLTATSDVTGQYRWAESERGTAMLQRTWLNGPVELSLDFIALSDQFYFAVTLPQDNGEVRRLQATWMVAELVGAPLPEDAALQMVIDSMQGTAEGLDEYLGQN